MVPKNEQKNKTYQDRKEAKSLAEFLLDHGDRPKAICKTCYEKREKIRKEKAKVKQNWSSKIE